MNVPIPPVFLFEDSPGKFEVMDGQQRLSTISEFLENEFELKGLTIWKDLNGRRFNKLPPLIRGSLERAKLSAITLLTDPIVSTSPDIDLRAQVFDRLNTGGEKLNPQELRNSLYSGPFNKMLRQLAANPIFTSAWGIPLHGENINSVGEESDDLKNNNLYKRMIDCEIVLRFFAFRDPKNIFGSVKSTLDRTMRDRRFSTENEINILSKRFVESIELCREIFGSAAFRIFEDGKPTKLSRPLFDAQMIAIDRNIAHREKLKSARDTIIARIKEITEPSSAVYPLIVGRANTAESTKKRIDLVAGIVREVAER